LDLGDTIETQFDSPRQGADEMGGIIAVAQRKGGVGKTTLAVSLAAELRRRGNDVALVDSDPQRSACHWAEPGHLEFPVYEIPLADQAVSKWVRDVRGIVARYLIIDTAPHDRALGASIALSNLVVVPCTPSGLDIEATVHTLEIIHAVRARRNGWPNVILVPNRVDARTLEGRQVVQELERFGEVVSTTIGDRSSFVRSFATGQFVADLPASEPAYREIQLLSDLIQKTLDNPNSGSTFRGD
jgi:chromosome partitioning protein